MRRVARKRPSRGAPENLSDLAAWLYTDLLLGLAVAFLGAGSFLIAIKASGGPGDPGIQTYQLSCNEIEWVVRSNASPLELESQALAYLRQEATTRGWTDPKPGILLVYGGSGGGDISIGTRVASRFADEVVGRTSLLGNIKLLELAARTLSADSVRLTMFVVYKGAEESSGC